jgi:hypothetical protein
MRYITWLVVFVCGCSGSTFTTVSELGTGGTADGGLDATGGSTTLETSPTGGTAGATASDGGLELTGGAQSTTTGGSSVAITSAGASTMVTTGGASTGSTGGASQLGGQSAIVASTGGLTSTGGTTGTGDPGRCPCAYTGQCNPRYGGCWTTEPGSPYTCVRSPLMCGANPTATGALYCYEC